MRPHFPPRRACPPPTRQRAVPPHQLHPIRPLPRPVAEAVPRHTHRRSPAVPNKPIPNLDIFPVITVPINPPPSEAVAPRRRLTPPAPPLASAIAVGFSASDSERHRL
jgi:hypothetical protein